MKQIRKWVVLIHLEVLVVLKKKPLKKKKIKLAPTERKSKKILN